MTEEEYPGLWKSYVEGVVTVAALKRMIQYWPDEDLLGNPTEVYLSEGRGLSGPFAAIEAWKNLYGSHHYEVPYKDAVESSTES